MVHAEDIRVGATIKRARSAQQISLTGLQRLTGIDRGTLSKIENGIVRIGLKRATILSRALSLDVTTLCDVPR